ncbi:hypothetical protein ACFPM0_31245 [Pseudonocardia sulfidoxydans]|uniref:hypothetical protein n=1 Tax=Pseudonocardia sulfidoxydans TaxID=54011 RepID=UPI00361F54CB
MLSGTKALRRSVTGAPCGRDTTPNSLVGRPAPDGSPDDLLLVAQRPRGPGAGPLGCNTPRPGPPRTVRIGCVPSP